MSEQSLSLPEGRYFAVDIGGTNTRIGLFPSLNSPHYEPVARFPTQQSYQEQLQQIVHAIQGYGQAAPDGIGVSIAGRIAKDGRRVIMGPNLPDYLQKPFADDLEYALNGPVRLAHDTVCGLLGEKAFGVLREVERCAYVTVSTGTGAAIQLGKAGTALISSIEIGHQILDGNTRTCLCGQIGCLETFTGGRQITLRYGLAPSQIKDGHFWETFCQKLAIGLVNLVTLSRIDVVAVSGAIVLQNEHLLTNIQQKVDGILKDISLTLSKAELGEDAPLVGAMRLLTVDEQYILH